MQPVLSQMGCNAMTEEPPKKVTRRIAARCLGDCFIQAFNYFPNIDSQLPSKDVGKCSSKLCVNGERPEGKLVCNVCYEELGPTGV